MSRYFGSDKELLAACLKGDKAAWDVFVDRYAKLVHWSIRKTLADSEFRGRPELAGDIFQIFFERLISGDKLSELREITSLAKFLSVSASYATMDHLKSLRRREAKEGSLDKVLLSSEGDPAKNQTPQDILASDLSTDTAVLDQEKTRIMAESLRCLSDAERIYLEMCYFDGKTHKEISLLLGIPENTVASSIRRAREKLKPILLKKGLI